MPLALDLVVLVPGKDDQEALEGLLSARSESLGIRPLRFKVLRHPRKDPGCFNEAQAVLQPLQTTALHALVIFDHQGSGQEGRPAREVASEVRHRLQQSGWGDRAEVMVIDPEIEIWVWSDSPHVDEALGWRDRQPTLRQWLRQNGLWQAGEPKPSRPKESLEAARREVRLQRSAAIYRQLAERVSLDRCQDTCFAQFRRVLRTWFAAQT